MAGSKQIKAYNSWQHDSQQGSTGYLYVRFSHGIWNIWMLLQVKYLVRFHNKYGKGPISLKLKIVADRALPIFWYSNCCSCAGTNTMCFTYFLLILTAWNLNSVNGKDMQNNHITIQLETRRDNRCDLQQLPIIQHIFMKIIKRLKSLLQMEC
jgi:hypothetical protein